MFQMSGPWFTDSDAVGELPIENRDGSWYVQQSAVGDVGETKVLLDDAELPESSGDCLEIGASVSSFRRGSGGSTSFLSVTVDGAAAAEGSDDSEPSPAEENSNVDPPSPTGSASGKEWDLADFDGSGEYVDVEARIEDIEFVRKDVSGHPDLKGKLTDGSVRTWVFFVVDEDVNHPYFEEGERFLFRDVKDHRYEEGAQVQVLVTEHTRFEQLS
jgi:hypothetical protein